MPTDHEKLEPTPFEAAPPAQGPAEAGAHARPPAWTLPALGGLLVLALLVIFWLPEQVSAPAPSPRNDAPGTAAAAQPGTPAAAPRPAAPEASPWTEAQAAKLRKEAQDVLQALLELQFSLEERGAPQWAATAFARAADTAVAGDELYRQREYAAAADRYRESLAAFEAVAASAPQIVDGQLALARQGIEALQPGPVAQALALAALIEPENAELANLQQRAAALEPLMALLEAAASAEQRGDLGLAEQSLLQAAALDGQHAFAAAELARVSAAYVDQQFNDAMSAGYSALDAGRYSDARREFRRAAGLRADSAEAASALQEVAGAEQGSRLQSLQQEGSRHEQAEQWQRAVEAYEQARDIDSNVSFAAEGLERSRGRARLDRQFRAAIDQPERLADVAVAEATAQLLQQARKISPQGPVLREQIAALDTLLARANTPVQVTLRSDTQTEVIIYKVARLGRFEQRELSLRPGTYTVRGSRNGYRDVLEQFTISHEGAPAPITIACTEPIN